MPPRGAAAFAQTWYGGTISPRRWHRGGFCAGGRTPPSLAKRISEKCPNGGIARRSISRMPSVRAAQRA